MPQIVLNHRLRQVAPGAHPARPVRSQASADNVDSAPPEAARGWPFGRAAASPFAVGLQPVLVCGVFAPLRERAPPLLLFNRLAFPASRHECRLYAVGSDTCATSG